MKPNAVLAPVWSAEYATGIPEVDQDHCYLFDLISKIIESSHSGKRNRLIYWEPRLTAYATEHFAREERLMEQYLPDWDQRAGHIAEHRRYWVQAANLKWTTQEEDFLHFLSDWWTKHVLGWDKVLGVALQQHLNN